MSRRTIIMLTLGAAVVLAASLIGTSLLLTHGSSSKSAEPLRISASEAAEMNALLEGIPQQGTVLGKPDAPVTLDEYVDLQCPYCARFAMDSFPTILRSYVRTGRVRVVFRGLSFLGPDSLTALETALAAGSQQRLWHVVELLFANQGAENSGWVTEGLLRSVGGAVPGLAVEKMLGARSAAEVARARADARAAAAAAGVNGTPMFAVGPTGGKATLLRSNDLQQIRAALDEALSA